MFQLYAPLGPFELCHYRQAKFTEQAKSCSGKFVLAQVNLWCEHTHFHQLCPLGRVGLVVAMSVSACCPLPMQFFPKPWEAKKNNSSNLSKKKFQDKSRNLFKFVLVILCASVERVGVSRMRDFFVANGKHIVQFALPSSEG